MLHIGVAVAGAYFILLSLWWITQTTIQYYHCRQHHTDYYSSLSANGKSWPVDGVCKVILASIFALGEYSFDTGYYEDVFLSNTELGTIFVFLLFSGVMDILAKWGQRSFYQHVGYAGLALLFAAEATILLSRAQFSIQPKSTIFSVTAYGAIGCLLFTMLEAIWPKQVLCSVMRSFLLLLQGTWFLHISLLTDSGLPSGDEETRNSNMMLFSLFFTWHGAINFMIIICLWLLLGKMVEKNCCICFVSQRHTRHSSAIFLENRVRFNYHVLDRIDSDSDQ